jgi:peptidoglycan/xylan/chitin deacetylase (PgdA/CDA1 family)
MLPVLRDEGIQCLFFVTGSSAGAERATLWYEELFLLFLKAPARHFDISYEDVRIAGDLGEREQRRTLWWDCVKRLSQVGAETRSQWTAAARARFGLQSWNVVEESVSAQRRFSLLKASDLGELVAAGMTIGAHTVSHPILSFCPVEIAKFEIGESRTRLESVLNTRVWAFAYPFGDAQSVSPQVIGMVRDAGYAAAFPTFQDSHCPVFMSRGT